MDLWYPILEIFLLKLLRNVWVMSLLKENEYLHSETTEIKIYHIQRAIKHIILIFFFLKGNNHFFWKPLLLKRAIIIHIFLNFFSKMALYFLLKIYSIKIRIYPILKLANYHFPVWKNDQVTDLRKFVSSFQPIKMFR